MFGGKNNKRIALVISLVLTALLIVLLICFQNENDFDSYRNTESEIYFDDELYTRDEVTDELSVVSDFAADCGITGVIISCNNSEQDNPDQSLAEAGYDKYYMIYNNGEVIIIVVDSGVPRIFE